MIHKAIYRRAVETALALKGDGEHDGPKISKGRLIALVLVIFGGLLGHFLINYVAILILNLTAVEAPASVALPLDAEALLDGVDRSDESLEAATNKPVSSSLRATLMLLKEKFGIFGIFHGIGAYIIYTVAFTLVTWLISALFGVIGSSVLTRLGMFICIPAAAVITAKIAMAFAHSQIAVGGTTEAGRKLSVFSRTKRLTWPQAKATMPTLLMIYGIVDLLLAIQLPIYQNRRAMSFTVPILHLVSYVAQFWFRIVLVRQQASAFPSEQETVVRVDRTFGLEVEGDRVLTFKEASTNVRRDLWRIVKMGLKVYGLVALYLALWVGTLFALGLPELMKKQPK